MKKSRNLIYLIAVVSLILIAIITTAIINAVQNNQSSPADIRAKAGATSTLKLTGVVSEVKNLDGTLIVNSVQFSEESRSGPARDYGAWTVTPPPSFSLGSVSPGQSIRFVVSSSSLDVLTKKVTAAEVTVLR